MKKIIKAFTLVELIVVITILAILGTIAFISLQGYSKTARNSVRISDLSSIDKQLELYYIKAGSLPIPDDYIEIYASGTLIGYQGYAGKRVLDLIGVYNGGKDPLDDEYYTYMTDLNRKNYQIMGFLEDNQITNLSNKIYAEGNERTPIVKGKELGIIVNLNNDPIQKLITTSFDISTTNDTYKAYLNNDNIITGTGTELKKASPTYSCNRILQLMRNKKTGDYNIDNYYSTGSSTLNVNCDLDLDGLTPVIKNISGTGTDNIHIIQTDSDGNIYVGGFFSSSSVNIFGQTINNIGSSLTDYFLAKLDNNLNLIWLKNGGGTGSDYIYALNIDSDGNIYVGGHFTSSNINIFGENVTLIGQYDYFLAKLDKDGNKIWVKNGCGSGIDYIYSINNDLDGNVIIAGVFSSNNPIIFGESIVHNGGNDYFLAKLDEDGNKIWVKSGSSTNDEQIRNISTDNNGNIYVGGIFNSSSNIFGSSLTSNGGYDLFLAKLDNDGNNIWVKNGGGTGNDYIYSVKVDNNGHIYSGGFFNSGATLFGENVISNGLKDYFLAKLDENGNTIWVKNGGGSNDDEIGRGLEIYNGNIYVGGYFTRNSNVFGKNVTSNGAYDYFLSKLDENGNTIWVKNGGGSTDDEIGRGLTIYEGNIYVGGYFTGNSNVFGKNMTSSGLSDTYIIKLFK